MRGSLPDIRPSSGAQARHLFFSPPKGKAFALPRNFCKNLRKKSQLDIRRVDGILLLYEIELLENEQFAIEQCIAKQKSTEKQVIPNV